MRMMVSGILLAGWVHAAPTGGEEAWQPEVSRSEAELLSNVFERESSDVGAAISQLSEAIAKSPECSAALDFTLGNLLADSDPDAASRCYRAAIAKFPLFRSARMNLGRVLLSSGKLLDAGSVFAGLVSDDLASAETYLLLGHAHQMRGVPVAAESAYRQSLMLDPSRLDAMAGLSKSLLAQERFSAARAMLAACTVAAPDKQELWSLRANAAIADGALEDAVVQFESARRLGKLAAGDLLSLAGLYLAIEQPDAAVRVYGEACADTEVSADTLISVAEALLLVGRESESMGYVARVEGMLADQDEALKVRVFSLNADLAVARRDHAAAIVQYLAVLELRPMDGKALIGLGDCQAALGKIEEAVIYYERAVRCPGSEADALVQHGLLEARREHYAEAIKLLEAAQRFKSQPHVGAYVQQLQAFGIQTQR